MSIKITYFVHGTTPYNEQGIASGRSDIDLSEQGILDAQKLKGLTLDSHFDAVYTSDLPRALHTAQIVFETRYPIILEPRLQEINDGNYTGTPIKDVPGPHLKFLDEQYPGGESFRDVEKRIQNLLDELKTTRDGQHVVFMAHFAPQMALDVLLGGKSWERAFAEDWRKTKAWKPGWEYELK